MRFSFLKYVPTLYREGHCHHWDLSRNFETLLESPIANVIKKPLQRDLKNGEFQRGNFCQVSGTNKCRILHAQLKRKSCFPELIVLSWSSETQCLQMEKFKDLSANETH